MNVNKNTFKMLFDWTMFLTVLCFSAVQPFGLCQFAIQKDTYHFHVSDHKSHITGLLLYDWLTVIHFRRKCLQKVHCNLLFFCTSLQICRLIHIFCMNINFRGTQSSECLWEMIAEVH